MHWVDRPIAVVYKYRKKFDTGVYQIYALLNVSILKFGYYVWCKTKK